MAKSKTPDIKQLLKSRFMIIPIAVLLVAAVAIARSSGQDSAGSGNSTNPPTPPVNMSPPTAQERQETENHKQQIAQQQSQSKPPSPSPGNSQVTPIITEATKDRVLAYISGVVEDGGTCTATATNGTSTVTATATAFHDATTTDCPPLNFSPALSSGTWDIYVTYSSTTHSGQSLVMHKVL